MHINYLYEEIFIFLVVAITVLKLILVEASFKEYIGIETLYIFQGNLCTHVISRFIIKKSYFEAYKINVVPHA